MVLNGREKKKGRVESDDGKKRNAVGKQHFVVG